MWWRARAPAELHHGRRREVCALESSWKPAPPAIAEPGFSNEIAGACGFGFGAGVGVGVAQARLSAT